MMITISFPKYYVVKLKADIKCVTSISCEEDSLSIKIQTMLSSFSPSLSL